MPDLPRTEGKALGGRSRLPPKDMIFSSAFKVRSTFSGRRFMTDLREAHEKGYISKLPNFNSIFNYLESDALTPILWALITQSSLPLKAIESDFAVDSSRFSTGRCVTWFDAKYRVETEHRNWVKVHQITGVKTNVVTSGQISRKHADDSPYFAPLVNTIARHFQVQEVAAERRIPTGATWYLETRRVRWPIFPSSLQPLAMGRLRLVGKYVPLLQPAPRGLSEALPQRSNAEFTFNMIKAKFDNALSSKTEQAQINEQLCKILCHNLCCLIQSFYEFGIEIRFCADFDAAQKLA